MTSETNSDAERSDSPDAPPGISVAEVTNWLGTQLEASGTELVGELDFHQIAGGRSNLTFKLTDESGNSWALRRPPTGNVLATAHDVGREHHVMSTLAPTPVPVPTMVAMCTDHTVTGADFFVMDWVEGSVVRNQNESEAFSPEIQRRMGQSVVENLATIHKLDIDAIGFGNFAKREGYVDRQLRRWSRQVENADSPPDQVIVDVYERLVAAMPQEQPVRLVHGDYRLDNTIVDDDGDVVAVLDWELTTLGDPLADLGAMLAYWSRPNDGLMALDSPPTLAHSFIERDEVVALYEAEMGSSVGDVSYYQAFATWRLACIMHGVVDRYRAGAMGEDDFDVDIWAGRVGDLATTALRVLEGGS